MSTQRGPAAAPGPQASFLGVTVGRLKQDPQLIGVAAGGSYLAKAMDEFSDLDLVIVVEPADYEAVMRERRAIAARLGPLLAAFTGEHVGEPRLLICLYGPPLIHVDLKFVSLADASIRVEDPAVLWDRDGRASAALRAGTPRSTRPDLQWIEDRFWVWIHYGAGKVGRGELFEAIDCVGFLRGHVLGPLALAASGAPATGVRKLEFLAPELAREMRATVARYDPASCADALRASADLYRGLRARLAGDGVILSRQAEEAAMAYLVDVEAKCRAGARRAP